MFQSADLDELRLTLDSIQIPAFAVDVISPEDFRIAGINQAHGAVAGFDNHAVAGKRLTDILSVDDAETIAQRYQRCLCGGTPIQYNEILETPGGQTNWLTSLIPMRNADGEITRLLGNSVGFRVGKDGPDDETLIDEVAYLSAISAMPLFQAIEAVRQRLSSDDLRPEDRQFYRTFLSLCETSIDASRRVRALAAHAAKRGGDPGTLLNDSALADAIEDLTRST